MTDRRVHASTPQMEVVRYDREGKWYLEPIDKNLPRQQVSVRDAASYAAWAEGSEGSTINYGVPGGTVFERILKEVH